MASITSIISLFVLLLATYCYSLPVDGNKGHMHLMDNGESNQGTNVHNAGTSAEQQESGENGPKDQKKPMPQPGHPSQQESDKRWIYGYPHSYTYEPIITTAYQPLTTKYIYVRDFNETSQNATDDKRYLSYIHSYPYSSVYYRNLYTPVMYVRDLNNSSKDQSSQNKTERAIYLSNLGYAYSPVAYYQPTSYVYVRDVNDTASGNKSERAIFLTSPYAYSSYITYPNTYSYSYLLKREVDADGQMPMPNESSKNKTERALYYTNSYYTNYVEPMTIVHEPAYSRVLVARDIKDNESKDQSSQNKTERAIYLSNLGYDYGYGLGSYSYVPATSYLYLRDLNSTKNESSNKDERAIFLTSPYSYSSYITYPSYSYSYLLKREIDGEGKMAMENDLKNKTDKRYVYLNDYVSYVQPMTTYYHQSYSPVLVVRDLKDNESSKDQSTNKTERAIFLDYPYTTYSRTLYTNLYESPLYLLKRGSEQVNAPGKNEQGVKNESGEEQQSNRPHGMNPIPNKNDRDSQAEDMSNEHQNQQSNNKNQGQKQPINQAQKSHN